MKGHIMGLGITCAKDVERLEASVGWATCCPRVRMSVQAA